MSLIGCVAEISETGLVASQTADRMAAAGPETTSASRATAQIASASDSGPINEASSRPPRRCNGAISSGSPMA